MTPIEVYIRIAGSTKPSHWLPHFVPNTLLLQEISYQVFVNGVAASLHRKKKGIWPRFLIMTPVCKIENLEKAKDELNLISSFKFRKVSFRRHDSQGNLKECLQQVRFEWSYSHKDLLPGELSQQLVLVK